MSSGLAKPRKISGCGIHYIHQHAQCGGLSAAVGTEHSEYVAALHVQVKLIDCAKPSEIFGELLSG